MASSSIGFGLPRGKYEEAATEEKGEEKEEEEKIKTTGVVTEASLAAAEAGIKGTKYYIQEYLFSPIKWAVLLK